MSLREAGAKCGFHGDEYSSRLVHQFILGLKDKTTQNKLLQEPPTDLDSALLIARHFEAANATMKTLAKETAEKLNTTQISSVNSRPATKTCYSCNGDGHLSRQCPTMNNFRHKNNVYAQGQEKLCYVCQKPRHLACSCPLANPPPLVNPLPQWPPAQGLIKKYSQMNRHSTVCYKCGKLWA